MRCRDCLDAMPSLFFTSLHRPTIMGDGLLENDKREDCAVNRYAGDGSQSPYHLSERPIRYEYPEQDLIAKNPVGILRKS